MTHPSLVFLDYSGSVLDEQAKAWLLTALMQSPDNHIVTVVPQYNCMSFIELTLDTFENVDTVLKTTYGRGGDPNFVKLLNQSLTHPDLNIDVSHIIFCTDLYIEPFKRPCFQGLEDVRFEFVTEMEPNYSPNIYEKYHWAEQFATLTQTVAPDEYQNTLDYLRAEAQRKIIDQSVDGSSRSSVMRKI